LRDSGSVEEKADNVFFIHRPFSQSVDEIDDTMEFISWKSRESGTWIGHMRFTGEMMFFDSPPPGQIDRYERCCDGRRAKSVPA
jgi:replicative DNA helicase